MAEELAKPEMKTEAKSDFKQQPKPETKTDLKPQAKPDAAGSMAPEAQKKSIASRGIPSKDSLYLPPHNSPALRPFEDSAESATHTVWDLEEVVNFVFPKHYQAKYNEIAMKFLQELSKKITMDGTDLNGFVKNNSLSKATFYNRVLPRLKRIGMIKVERDTIVALESKRKFRPMKIHLSKTFGNYLNKIGNSWHAVVDTAREKANVKKE